VFERSIVTVQGGVFHRQQSDCYVQSSAIAMPRVHESVEATVTRVEQAFGGLLTKIAYSELVRSNGTIPRHKELREGTRAQVDLLTISHRRPVVCFEGVSATEDSVHQEGVSEFREKVRPVSFANKVL
jgi:hypothetical protein